MNLQAEVIGALDQLRRGDRAGAERRAAELAAHAPGDPGVLYLQALLLLQVNDFAGAERYLRASLAGRDDPETKLRLAQTLVMQGQGREAVPLMEALVRDHPRMPQLQHDLANALAVSGRAADALAAYGRGEAMGLDEPQFHYNHALALEKAGDLEGALTRMQRAHHADPRNLDARLRVLLLKRLACDWSGEAAAIEQLGAAVDDHIARGDPRPVSPFILNALPVPTALHRKVAARYAEALGGAPGTAPPARALDGRPLRVGYLSPDLRQHAVGVLIKDLFAAHDPSRVEAHALSLMPVRGQRQDLVREAVRVGAHAFHDLAGQDPRSVAAAIRALELDLLVDMGGYTEGMHPAVTAARPAPTTVSWLGYLNTLGSPWTDYVLSDPVSLTAAEAAEYSEAPVLLPVPVIPLVRSGLDPVPSERARWGLAEDAQVLASFNHAYKIDARCFAAWMTLLAEDPARQLWLFAGDHAQARAQLQSAAQAAGVDPARLVFADRVPMHEHLGRMVLADLLLDTWSYSGGATAVGALEAGVPFVTLAGERVLNRMGASLLRAVGVPELVAEDAEGYLSIARDLLADDARRAELRERIRAGFDAAADPRRWAAALEDAFHALHRRRLAGEAPTPLDLSADTSVR